MKMQLHAGSSEVDAYIYGMMLSSSAIVLGNIVRKVNEGMFVC